MRLLQEHRIDDLQQLFDYKKEVNERIFEVRAELKKLRTSNGSEVPRRDMLKDELKQLRYQIILCERIIHRNQQMKEKLQAVRKEEQQKKRKEWIK